MSGGLSIFQVGEKVGFLYESGGGTIVRKDEKGVYHVIDEFDFERPFLAKELVRIHGTDYHLPDDAVAQINDDDTVSEKHYTVHTESKTGARKPLEIWELDLHIESLLDSHLGMSNAEILAYQLKELRNFFSKAKDRHIRKLVIIHGVGEGVLKDEVRLFLSRKDGIEYYDADFREYGKGATSVELRYNY